jgi:xanthine dehydrogenase small subunit
MGTLGGNIASASPIGDVPPVLMAYDASLKLVSCQGERDVKARDFVIGYRQTLLNPGEVIHSVFIPFPHKKNHIRSYKISKRKDLDISTVSSGFQVLVDKDKIEDIALVYGGVAAMTKRAEKAESFLLGKDWSRENVEHAMTLIDEDFTPISDARSGAEARKIMARNLLLKFWNDTK